VEVSCHRGSGHSGFPGNVRYIYKLTFDPHEECHHTLVTDESGRITGTLSSGKEVTRQVRAEKGLRKANQELSRFSRELERMVQQPTEALEERNRQEPSSVCR